jgi:hypothetical protein
MLNETFRALSNFGRVREYRYIGLGSNYFGDFILFHKSLGISNMISIEHDGPSRARFLFNRPFLCVNVKFGESGEILPQLLWNVRTILWLDYDGPLDKGMLADVQFFCANAPSGSVLLVTVDGRADKQETPAEDRLHYLNERLGDKVPRGLSEKDLAGWGTAKVYRRIIHNEIQESLANRNGPMESGSKILYRQLFNFNYQDGARMLSVGGLVYDAGQSDIMEACGFSSLQFLREGEDACEIQVPNLTLREIRLIDSQLPNTNVPGIASWIPKEDLEKYSLIYRYFPHFVEAEL